MENLITKLNKQTFGAPVYEGERNMTMKKLIL